MSHKANDEFLDAMRDNAMECPMCKEIELTFVGSIPYALDEYECQNCRYYCTFPKMPIPITTGWGKRIKTKEICPFCSAEMPQRLEQELQWWAQQDQDNEWIENSLRYEYEGDG